MQLNLNSIIIFVKDIGRLKDFYTCILQLDIIEETGQEWLLLKAGNCTIGLHRIGSSYADKSEGPSKFYNNTKIVFEIEEDINQVRAALLEKNVLLKEIKTFDNYPYWLCDGEDPEGNVFQLRQKNNKI